MKKIVFGFLAIIFAISTQAQTFKVIKLKGTIKVDGQTLVKGGSITLKSNSQISFEPSDAAAAVYSNSEGMGVLYDKQTKEDQTIHEKVEGQVADYFKLSTKTTGTRGGGLCNSVDIQNHFGVDFYLILDNEIRLQVCKSNYPMNNSQFFYVSYNYERESEPINKMLSYEDDILILSKDEIFKIDGKSIESKKVSNFTFYYYQADKELSEELCKFHPVFSDNDELISEVEIFVSMLKSNNATRKEIENQVEIYLTDNYGKPYKEDLIDWLEKYISF